MTIHVNYCYICNKVIKTEIPEGRGVADPDLPCYSDIRPITCRTVECKRRFEELPDVKYTVEGVQYDEDGPKISFEGSFLEFAKGIKGIHLQQQDDVLQVSISEEHRTNSTYGLETLFQELFFFGLIREFLGSGFHRENYIDTHRYLSVDYLIPDLSSWMKFVFSRSQGNKELYHHYSECLNIVIAFLKATMVQKTLKDSFNPKLRCLIATVAEIFTQAVNFMFPKESVRWVFGVFVAPSRQDLMTNNVRGRWCKHDAAFFTSWQGSPTLCASAFYSQLDRPFLPGDHQSCSTESKCKLMSDGKREFESQHFENNCQCDDDVGLDSQQVDEMCAILEKGGIPLIRIQQAAPDRSLHISVEEKHDTDYVAISHVCSQGLGNSFAHSLRRCQLGRLFRHIKSLRGCNDLADENSPIYIWLDTLCCPIYQHVKGDQSRIERLKKSREKAINRMRDTYHNATLVLVLDVELERTEISKMPVLEVTARFMLSFWTRRLWTLQEGVLGRRVWVQFHDRAISTDSLALALRHEQRSLDMRKKILAFAILKTLLGIRAFVNSEQPGEFLASLVGALQRRSTTKADDEPLCMATVLGLHVDSLHNYKGSQRMQKLWDLISEANILPKGILFSAGPKLTIPGYRWALASFLQLGAINDFGVFGHGEMLESDQNGLRMNSPGMLFSMSNVTEAYDCLYENTERDYLALRNVNDRWILLKSFLSAEHEGQTGACMLNFEDEYGYGWIPMNPENMKRNTQNAQGILLKVTQRGEIIRCTPERLVVGTYVTDDINRFMNLIQPTISSWHTDGFRDRRDEILSAGTEEAKSNFRAGIESRVLEGVLRYMSRSDAATPGVSSETARTERENYCRLHIEDALKHLRRYGTATKRLSGDQKWLVT